MLRPYLNNIAVHTEYYQKQGCNLQFSTYNHKNKLKSNDISFQIHLSSSSPVFKQIGNIFLWRVPWNG